MTTLPLCEEIPSEDGPKRLNYWPTPKARDCQTEGFQSGLRRDNPQIATLVKANIDPLTSSPGATRASHSHSPGSAWARKMTAISGRTLLRSLPISGPVGACLRTLLGTSLWGSTVCYLTWKKSATPAGRLLYRLVPSTPPTGATGFGSWPTPDAGMVAGGRSLPDGTSATGATPDGRKVQVGLTNVVAGQKLNPDWVTVMMGLPVGWLDLED